MRRKKKYSLFDTSQSTACENGRLYQMVPEEFECLKGKDIPLEMSTEKEIRAVFPKKGAFIKLSGTDLERGLSICFAEDGTKIFYEGNEKNLHL